MKIYTSYHSKRKDLKEAGVVPVGISWKKPHWLKNDDSYKYKQCYHFFIPAWLWPQRYNKAKYEKAFKEEVLAFLDPDEVWAYLEKLSDGKDIALLDYQKDREQCHRKLVAEWLEKKFGIEVLEYDFTPKSKNPKTVQGKLF